MSDPNQIIADYSAAYEFALEDHLERIQRQEALLDNISKSPVKDQYDYNRRAKLITSIKMLKIESNRFARFIHRDLPFPYINDTPHSTSF